MDNQPSDKHQTAQEHRHENLGHGTWLCIALGTEQKGPSQTPPDVLVPRTLFSDLHLLLRKESLLSILTDF